MHSIHERRGATFGEINGREVVLHYGAPADEYAAARSAASLFDLSCRQMLRLTGEDRVSFLQGMVTNDVKKLPEWATAYAALLTTKGAMVADARILRRPGDLLLDVEPGYARPAKTFLEKYVISEEVEISDCTQELGLLRLIGPKVPLAIDDAWGPGIPEPAENRIERVEFEGEPVWIIGSDVWKGLGVDLLTTRAKLPALLEWLLERGAASGLHPAGFDALEILRVEAGVPRLGQDMDEHTIPLEANLVRAISYDKGCYIGQEVIARATFRGHVNRKLTGLVLGTELPPPRAELSRGDKKVGWITSAVRSPSKERVIALGYVHRDSLEPGTALEVAGYPAGAVVRALPFAPQ